ncbi:MAG: DUF2079 domain-containing protein [Nitrospirae bacterium]|nr:MAG: DUF2079 domain-containing protein [Nitrospirota bacterium]
MLQLVLLTLTVGYLVAGWVGRARESVFAVSPVTIWLAVIIGIAAYAAGLSYLSLIRHHALFTGVWDLGYYEQLVWALSNWEIPPISTVWGGHPWGNHATFVLLVVAPFLRLFPDPSTLLIIQSITLALGAFPSFCIGRSIWGNQRAGVVFAGAYLLYPPLQFANLFDFHADIFATPILLSAFAALFAGRVGWALVWAGLLILVKEDMALVSVMFGLYVAVVHRRRAGFVLASVACVSFVLLVGVIIPGWIDRPYFSLFNRWTHLGASPWEIIMSPLLRPAVFFGTILQPERLGYLVLLLIPLAGLPLLAPEILAIGLPPLASNLLSSLEAQYTIRGHYTVTLTPILIVAAVVGGRRMHEWLQQRGWTAFSVLAGVAATSVTASLAFSPLPWSRDPSPRKHFWDATPRSAMAQVIAHIPPEASVSAANHLGAHVALRKTIQLFPEGVDTADFVFVDVGGLDYVGPSPQPEAFSPLLRRLVDTRPLVVVKDGLALFGRGEPSPDAGTRLVALRAVSMPEIRRVGEMTLVSGSVTPSLAAPREYLRARYTWGPAARGRGMPCIAETLISSDGIAAWEQRRPMFHALLAGEQWPTGLVADDAAMVAVPETVPPGRYTWVVTAWYGAGPVPCRGRPDGIASLAVADVQIRPW